MRNSRIKSTEEAILMRGRGTISFFHPSSFVLRPSLLVLYSVFCLLSSVCSAQQIVSSTELIEKAKEFDGKEIVYQGEAIGEVMARGGYFWINLNDGENAIGIWAANNFSGLVSFTGSYTSRGDWLEVKGVFNRACKLHGGDLDIHALQMVKVRGGRRISHQLVPGKHTIVIGLLGVFVCLLILPLFLRKQNKK